MKNASDASSSPATDVVRPGHVLGRYELLVPIAAGGMAQVWVARMKGARQFQKLVAIKTMLPKLSEDPQFEQMFLDEASLAAGVRHPNVVEILDLGEHAGVLYLVMEFIEGVPLNHLMKASKARGGLPTPVATRIALQASAGLHAAHELVDDQGKLAGLVHRDVSPQNILVTYDGVTKVVDFGVAKATAWGGGATAAGQIKGKVSYMAPEQIKGEALDRRVDVFAMGIVLYALTTGKHPFRRENEAATMYKICGPQAVTPPSRVIPTYPRALEPIVLKALAKVPADRYATCDELLRALDALPASCRASSDADVAVFVRELFDEKRAEKRRQIDRAIESAELAREHGSAPVIPIQDQVSSVSVPSTTSVGSQELSGVPSGLASSKGKWLGVAGLAALAVSGGMLFFALTTRSDDAPPQVRVREAPSIPEAEARAAAPATAEDVGDTQPLDEADDSDDEGANETDDPVEAPGKANAADEAATLGAKNQPTGVPQTPTTRSPKTTAAPAKPAPVQKPRPPTTTPKKSWKFDAGF